MFTVLLSTIQTYKFKILNAAEGLSGTGCVVITAGSCGLVKGTSITPIIVGEFENGDVSRLMRLSPKVTITSSDTSVVSVSEEVKTKGVLTAVEVGNYAITAVYSNDDDTASDTSVTTDQYEVVESTTVSKVALIGSGAVYINELKTILPVIGYTDRNYRHASLLADNLCLTTADQETCNDPDGNGFDDSAFGRNVSISSSNINGSFTDYALDFDPNDSAYSFRAMKEISTSLKLFSSKSDKTGLLHISAVSNDLSCIGFLTVAESFDSLSNCDENMIAGVIATGTYTCTAVSECKDLFSNSSFEEITNIVVGTTSSVKVYKAVQDLSDVNSYTVSRITGKTFLNEIKVKDPNIRIKPLTNQIIAKETHSSGEYSEISLNYLDKSFSRKLSVVSSSGLSSLDFEVSKDLTSLSYCNSSEVDNLISCFAGVQNISEPAYFQSASPSDLAVFNLFNGGAILVGLNETAAVDLKATAYESGNERTKTLEIKNLDEGNKKYEILSLFNSIYFERKRSFSWLCSKFPKRLF